jgi:hypothetical protein
VFDDPKAQWTPPVGDQRGRAPTWTTAENTLGYLGIEACGSPEAWANAGAPGAAYPLMTTDSRGVAPCCVLADIPGDGGFGLGGTAVIDSFVAVSASMEGQAYVATTWTGYVYVYAYLEGLALVTVSGFTAVTVSATMEGQAGVTTAWSTAAAVSATMEGQAGVTTAWSTAAAVSATMEGQASVVPTIALSVFVSAVMEGQAAVKTNFQVMTLVSAVMEGQAQVVTAYSFQTVVSAEMEGQATVVAKLGSVLVPQAYIVFSCHGSTPTVLQSQGIANITRLGVGHYRITFSTAFANANYFISGIASLYTQPAVPCIYPASQGGTDPTTLQCDLLYVYPTVGPNDVGDWGYAGFYGQ